MTREEISRRKTAPNKIWISTDTLDGYYMSNHPPYGEEYIRKDALLEWAKEKEKYSLTHAVKLAYRTMINKIESL